MSTSRLLCTNYKKIGQNENFGIQSELLIDKFLLITYTYKCKIMLTFINENRLFSTHNIK